MLGGQNSLLTVPCLCHCAYPLPSKSEQFSPAPLCPDVSSLCAVSGPTSTRVKELGGRLQAPADTALAQSLGEGWHQFWKPRVSPAWVCIWIIKPFHASSPWAQSWGGELSYLAFTFSSLLMVKFAFRYYELQVMKMWPQELVHCG